MDIKQNGEGGIYLDDGSAAGIGPGYDGEIEFSIGYDAITLAEARALIAEWDRLHPPAETRPSIVNPVAIHEQLVRAAEEGTSVVVYLAEGPPLIGVPDYDDSECATVPFCIDGWWVGVDADEDADRIVAVV